VRDFSSGLESFWQRESIAKLTGGEKKNSIKRGSICGSRLELGEREIS